MGWPNKYNFARMFHYLGFLFAIFNFITDANSIPCQRVNDTSFNRN